MHKCLVIVYSNTGTCRRLAQMLCVERGWPLGEIKEARTRVGFAGIWHCAVDSWLRRRPAIRYEGPPPGSYDTVVLVTPIWLDRLAAPMRSFVASHSSLLQHFGVLSVMGGRGAPDAVAEIERLTGRSPLLSAAFTSREVVDGSCAARLAGLAAALDGRWSGQPPEHPSTLSPQAA